MIKYHYLTDEEYEKYTTILKENDYVKTKQFLDDLREKYNLHDEQLVYNGCSACPHKCH